MSIKERLKFLYTGAQYSIELFPVYRFPDDVCLNVNEAIRRDWEAVGNDLKYVIEHYEPQEKKICSEESKQNTA